MKDLKTITLTTKTTKKGELKMKNIDVIEVKIKLFEEEVKHNELKIEVIKKSNEHKIMQLMNIYTLYKEDIKKLRKMEILEDDLYILRKGHHSNLSLVFGDLYTEAALDVLKIKQLLKVIHKNKWDLMAYMEDSEIGVVPKLIDLYRINNQLTELKHRLERRFEYENK
jgi:hypothetical protein